MSSPVQAPIRAHCSPPSQLSKNGTLHSDSLRGWNFISVPRTLANDYDTVGVVFARVADHMAGHSILIYNAHTGNWEQMVAGTKVKPLDGFWVYSDTTGLPVPLVFNNDPLTPPPTKNLVVGWNAIGFSDLTPASARDTMNSVQDQWARLISYDATLQRYEVSIANIDSGTHGNSNLMYPAKGYWVFMRDPGTLAAIGV